MAAYKRILLKLSGEALMGDDAYGINRATIVRIVREVQEVTNLGCELAIVIALCTRVWTPQCSSASCSGSALRTVASMPM